MHGQRIARANQAVKEHRNILNTPSNSRPPERSLVRASRTLNPRAKSSLAQIQVASIIICHRVSQRRLRSQTNLKSGLHQLLTGHRLTRDPRYRHSCHLRTRQDRTSLEIGYADLATWIASRSWSKHSIRGHLSFALFRLGSPRPRTPNNTEADISNCGDWRHVGGTWSNGC